MSDENNIFDEEDTQESTQNTTGEDAGQNNQGSDASHTDGAQSNNQQWNYYQQGNPQQQGTYQNSYQQNGYQTNGSQQYQQYQQPYYQNYQQQTGPNGKKLGQGFGIASLVLGIVSLVMFCTCINIVLAIAAIIFGIVQIVKYEKKGMAIGGIATAGVSIVLFFGCIGMLFANPQFIRMIEEDMITNYDKEDMQELQNLLDQYGDYHVNIEGSDGEDDYKVEITPGENGEPQVDIQTQDEDTL